MSGYGFVIVTVREARELGPDSHAPYVNLRIGSYVLAKGELSVVEKKRTAVGKGGNPVYNQNIGLELHYPLDACFLEIHVWDKNPFAPNESLGILHLPFRQLPLSKGDDQISKWYDAGFYLYLFTLFRHLHSCVYFHCLVGVLPSLTRKVRA
jgi:hypothetical protein